MSMTFSPEEAAAHGMALAAISALYPERLAIAAPAGDRTFAALNARANQLARALRARGLEPGDGVALVCSNRPEFAEVVYAVLRSGLRLTPINWNLTANEMALIVADCEARAIVADARFADAAARAAREAPRARVRLGLAGGIPGFESYDDALEAESDVDLVDPCLGGEMLYTSGTTGRPRGVCRPPGTLEREPGLAAIPRQLSYRPGEDLHLCTGPLYHAAPLAFSLTIPLNQGCGVVMMESWSAERCLELIEGYRITHAHMVPLMFRRLLALEVEERRLRDLSSLRMIVHGAAPCPRELKQSMIDWLGPVLYEYYAATEGWGCLVSPEEWLERPGTVGRPEAGQVEIRNEQNTLQPAGEPGLVYLRSPPGGRFAYFKDAAKTSSVYLGDHFTLGDVGYLDGDGYLFLCDRSADVINRGGVDVYPAEVDAVLLGYALVRDAATVGVPHPEWGEEVLSVVELQDGVLGSPELAERLAAHCREHLARYKCPRRIEFSEALPRYETGKVYRRLLRDEYRKGRH